MSTRTLQRPQPPTQRHITVRTPQASGRVPLRATVVCLAGLVALALAFVWSISAGDYPIPFKDVVATLFGAGDPAEQFVIEELRLPRSVVGLGVGASLGLSGALLQTFARNPLASPDILGITEGAAVGAVIVVVLGSSGNALAGGVAVSISAAALAGGLLTAVVLYALAWRKGMDGNRLILMGIGLSAILSACTSWLLVTANVWDVQAAYVWLAGSLNGRGMAEAVPVLITLAILAPLAVGLTATLRAMQMGDDTAQALGVRLQLMQAATLVVAVALAAIAVSAAGPIAFVAFVVPQVALRLVRGSRPPLIASAILGAVLVIAADTFSRVVMPTELPVGVVTAIVGAPYFVWLLIRSNRKVAV